jgi:CRISPR-associated Csx14 family protein
VKQTHATLIATVGSKPQLVTLALDLLLARGEAVQQAVVIHTSLERSDTRAAVACLGSEFALNYPGVQLRPVCLCGAGGQPLDDVSSEPAIREAFRVLYREIRAAKQAGQRVHLSIAGGRKTLAIYGMAAAQLLFDEGDAAWHLDSDPQVVESKALHAAAGQTRLIPVPVLRWSQVSPMLTDLAGIDDPFDAAQSQARRLQGEAWRRAHTFVQTVLTPAEREAVELLVREGLSNQQIGKRLWRSGRTVGHQLSAAYAKLCAFYELAGADRHTLMAVLGEYFREV